MVQTEHVIDLLQKNFPEIVFEIVAMTTTGKLKDKSNNSFFFQQSQLKVSSKVITYWILP